MNEVLTKSALAEMPLRRVPNVRALVAHPGARSQLSAIASKHLNPERLLKVVTQAFRTTPKLAECEPMSMLGALMTCAAIGLEPNTVLGHAYLVPFDKSKQIVDPKTGKKEWIKVPEVQLIIGYKGLIDLARRSGHITSIAAGIHYSDDDLWEYEQGTDAKLRHREGPQEGEKLHAYAIAKFKDGGHAFVVLPWWHIMRIRDGSQGWQSAVKFGKTKTSPWFTHEDAMAMKTAIRALSKYLPLSVEYQMAEEVDERRADYAAFALDPTQGGPLIDGESEEINEGETDTQAENVIDPKPDPKPEAKKPKEEPKAEAMPEHLQSLHDRIVNDLADATQPDHIDAILGMFEAEIGNGKAESAAFAKEIDAQIDAFRKAVA